LVTLPKSYIYDLVYSVYVPADFEEDSLGKQNEQEADLNSAAQLDVYDDENEDDEEGYDDEEEEEDDDDDDDEDDDDDNEEATDEVEEEFEKKKVEEDIQEITVIYLYSLNF
jgi:hypothetical protein